MEGANLALSNNLTVVIAVLVLVIMILAGLLFSVKGKLNALQAKYDYFTQGKVLPRVRKRILMLC